MKRLLAIIGVVAAGAAVVALVHRSSESAVEPGSGARTGEAPQAAIRTRRLAPGVEHRYAVTMHHASTPSEGAGFELAVEGEWVLGVVASSDPSVTMVRAELRAPHLEVRGTRSEAPKLAAPHTFTLDGEGRLISLQFPRDLDRESRLLLASLATTAQVSSSTVPAWTTVETDSLGSYEAAYRRDGATIAKTKTAYRKAANDEPLAITVVESAATIALRDDGWIDSIEQREQLRVGFDKASVVVGGRTTLRHLGERLAVAQAPGELETVAVDATSTAARDDDDRELLDGATLQDLVAVLGSVRTDANASAHTYLRMVALFRLDPEAARRAGQQLVAGGLDPRDASAVIGALGEAGTPVAQQALVAVVDTAAVPPDQRVAGALSLGLTGAPQPSTIETLATASRSSDRDLASTATLALGNAALRLASSDAAAAARQVDELLARLERTTELQDRILVLRALGNTGDPRILPALELALASPHELIRAAAAESLRLVPDGRADALIIGLLDDPSPNVRSSSIFAASHRRLDPVAQALAAHARTEQEAAIRRAIVELAGQRMNELPSLLRPIVVHAAEQDRDAEVRDLAKKFLG